MFSHRYLSFFSYIYHNKEEVIGMSVDFKLIGKRIQSARKQARLTQEALAEKLGVSVGYVSQIERGITKVNLETLFAVCTILSRDPGELLTGAFGGSGEYLEAEFADKFRKLDARQRKVVLTLIEALLAEN